jgi:hypothetical protein
MSSGRVYASTVSSPPSSLPVAHGDVYVAKRQRNKHKHLNSGQISDLIDDYNNLITHPDSLPQVKDAYVLTFFMILCEESLKGDDGTHVELDEGCNVIGDDDIVRRPVVEKLADTIRLVNPAGVPVAEDI